MNLALRLVSETIFLRFFKLEEDPFLCCGAVVEVVEVVEEVGGATAARLLLEARATRFELIFN